MKITEQPQSVAIDVNAAASFSVEASGVSSYQWQFSRDGGSTWQNAGFTGSRTNEMTVEFNSSRIQYVFRCELTGKDGSQAYTDTVKASEAMKITEQPQSVEIDGYETVSFSVKANGVSSYQWQFSRDGGSTWQNAGFSGSKTKEMTVEINSSRIKYVFRCELTGKDETKQYTDIVYVSQIFAITKQPSSVTADVNDTVTFQTAASGVSSYQWEFSRDNGTTWQNAGFTGSKTNTLTVELNSTRIQYVFRCKLVNAEGDVIYTDIVKAK
jgi:predicted secreted protein